MHTDDIRPWTHDHGFSSNEVSVAERRTRWVVAITAGMMVVEIAAGTVFGSMALLADGWHMATHAAALGIAAFAYYYARRHADDPSYSFGTGKISALGGFASAVALAGVALMVLGESLLRLAAPVAIHYDQALPVAVVGLVVNAVCALLLHDGRTGHVHHHEHDHQHGHQHIHVDHNIRGAYLHVLADALTSVLAILSLLAGRQLGWGWMDPMMGVVGSFLIARWSWSLLRTSGRVLLDAEVPGEHRSRIREAIEAEDDNRVADLHLWRVGPRHLAAIISIVTASPRDPAHYKRLLERFPDLSHVTVEVHECREGSG